MKRILAAAAAVVLALASALPASAQWHNSNVIVNSGNGVGNTIIAGNHGGGGFSKNVIIGSGNGAGNTIIARNGNGFAPGGFDPSGYAPGGFDPNGFDPSGFAPGGYSPYPHYPIPAMGGVNRNRIINSGNGAGNWIGAFNR